MDRIDKIIESNKNYIFRHYYSKNIFKRFVWKLLGKKTFYNIVYDMMDIAYYRALIEHNIWRLK